MAGVGRSNKCPVAEESLTICDTISTHRQSGRSLMLNRFQWSARKSFSSAAPLLASELKKRFGKGLCGGGNITPVASQTLEIWHEAVSHGTGKVMEGKSKEEIMNQLRSRVHSDCVFSPPTYFQSWKGKEEFLCIIESVSEVFGPSFEYHRQWISEDGHDWALEFTAKIGASKYTLDGMDLVKLDENGQIIEFRVLGRPPNAVSELKSEMMKKAGPKLVALKAKKSMSSFFS